MKKRIPILLVAVLCLSLSTHAFAAEKTSTDSIEIVPGSIKTSEDDFGNTRSIEMDIVQTKYCPYNLTVQLASRVFGTGTPIHYRYESITSKTLIINSSSGGNYIVPTSTVTHELSDNDQICTVVFYGDVKNSSGTIIIHNLRMSIEFDANEAQ